MPTKRSRTPKISVTPEQRAANDRAFSEVVDEAAARMAARQGPDGLWAPLAPSAKPCVYGPRGAFRKTGDCSGDVNVEGNRMPCCAAHRLQQARESLVYILKERENIEARADRARTRIRTLAEMVPGEDH